MSSDYPDHIFSKLTEKRQLQVLQSSLRDLDRIIGRGEEKNRENKNDQDRMNENDYKKFVQSEEERLNRYLNLMATSGLPKKIDLSPQQVDRLQTEVERRLGVTVREDQFLYRVRDNAKPVTQEKLPLKIVLHNVRSAFNVGAIIRTAECLQLEEVELTGYTPNEESESLKKTDMGALGSVKCRSGREVLEVLGEDISDGRDVYAVETIENAPFYDEVVFRPPVTLVFGNERFGLEEEVIEACTGIVRLPTYGQKNSLNVASAAAICSYEFNRQWVGLRGRGDAN